MRRTFFFPTFFNRLINKHIRDNAQVTLPLLSFQHACQAGKSLKIERRRYTKNELAIKEFDDMHLSLEEPNISATVFRWINSMLSNRKHKQM